jgi:hypothetical protein
VRFRAGVAVIELKMYEQTTSLPRRVGRQLASLSATHIVLDAVFYNVVFY